MIDLKYANITNGDFCLKDLNYEFHEENLYFLEGDNGAGKSTLLKYIYNNLLSEDRKKTFYAADTYAGYLDITIDETKKIFTTMYYESFSIDKFDFYCNILEVQDHKRNVKTLSSGEKIILMFCLLMSCNPKIILFDETLYPVDKNRRKKILTLLKNYVKEHEAIFIGTSHGDDINNYANIVLTLKDGELINYEKNI